MTTYDDAWVTENPSKAVQHSTAILLRLTPEQRSDAIRDMHRILNRVGMRPSQALHDAANAILDGGRINF